MPTANDYNNLNNNAFNFTINRMPHVNFRAVAAELPDITIPPARAEYNEAPQYFAGSAPEYGSFTLTFIVDENLINYEELYRWIMQQQFRNDFAPKTPEEYSLFSDGVLTTLTNSANVNRKFMFKDMFPIRLSSIQFDTRDTNVEPALCTCEFRFSEFKLIPMT